MSYFLISGRAIGQCRRLASTRRPEADSFADRFVELLVRRSDNLTGGWSWWKEIMGCGVNTSVVTIHRCVDESRYLSRDMYRDTVCNNRDTRDLATFLRFLFECLTDINCQSAKNYQCRMSSHPQQTAGSYSQLKVSNYAACPSSATNGVMTNVLSVVTGSKDR